MTGDDKVDILALLEANEGLGRELVELKDRVRAAMEQFAEFLALQALGQA